MRISVIDPWMQTIRQLLPASPAMDVTDERSTLVRRALSPYYEKPLSVSSSPHLVVTLIERTTSSTVMIAWRDSTRCYYGEQIWRSARAAVAGTCAMSGAQIRRGDRVFRPRRTKPVPVNAGAMILASVIEAY
ncbi:MAG: DUF3331 domain-containing protein [Paraburkholderia sp.]|uniref:DUF3331 domain-containing protein n=1 Tax=Paraburkholderia sp. TaxID=1926495 RepID=UPI003C4C0841